MAMQPASRIAAPGPVAVAPSASSMWTHLLVPSAQRPTELSPPGRRCWGRFLPCFPSFQGHPESCLGLDFGRVK
jgi:hypothetical protein